MEENLTGAAQPAVNHYAMAYFSDVRSRKHCILCGRRLKSNRCWSIRSVVVRGEHYPRKPTSRTLRLLQDPMASDPRAWALDLIRRLSCADRAGLARGGARGPLARNALHIQEVDWNIARPIGNEGNPIQGCSLPDNKERQAGRFRCLASIRYTAHPSCLNGLSTYRL